VTATDVSDLSRKNPAALNQRGNDRAHGLGVLLLILPAFLIFTHLYWVPAHGGMDQNAYLVAGRMLAELGSPQLRPADADAFVGRMWVLTPQGQYFPKYPLGLPLIVALVYKVAGPRAVYWISPLCTVFALWAIFGLARRFGGSIAAILCTLLLASSPVVLALANNHASHAADLCAVAWGMLCLLRWRERGGAWRAALAGVLIGFAATIRYTEAFLLIPLLLVAFWQPRRSLIQIGVLIICWAAPITALLIYNKSQMGVWTGYEFTGESGWGSSLSLTHLAGNGISILRLLVFTGLGLALPLGALGLILLTLRERKLGLYFWAWLLPALLLGGAYYWLPGDLNRVDAARFFLTALPPLAIGASWCLAALWNAHPRRQILDANRVSSGRVTFPRILALVIVIATATWNVRNAVPLLRSNKGWNAGIAIVADQLQNAHAPPGSLLFGPESYLNHLQFAADYQLYSTDDFDPAYYAWLSRQTPPSPLQISRFAARSERLNALGGNGRRTALRGIVNEALARRHRVFAIVPAEPANLPERLADSVFQLQTVSNWNDAQGDWRLIELTSPSE
jgi:4-amino-4-deoxy-L-arabinose transferase-like glycosyltransferase